MSTLSGHGQSTTDSPMTSACERVLALPHAPGERAGHTLEGDGPGDGLLPLPQVRVGPARGGPGHLDARGVARADLRLVSRLTVLAERQEAA
jgi:hypothetical protein